MAQPLRKPLLRRYKEVVVTGHVSTIATTLQDTPQNVTVVPRETYYGLPSDDRTRARVDIGTVLFKTQFNDNLWLTDTARAGNYYYANSYFSSQVENHVVPGAGRTGLLTVSLRTDAVSAGSADFGRAL
jgi:hypothetical protein